MVATLLASLYLSTFLFGFWYLIEFTPAATIHAAVFLITFLGIAAIITLMALDHWRTLLRRDGMKK